MMMTNNAKGEKNMEQMKIKQQWRQQDERKKMLGKQQTDENIQNIWHDNYYYTKSNFGLNLKWQRINQYPPAHGTPYNRLSIDFCGYAQK